MPHSKPSSRIGRLFAIMAIVEATTWLGLLVGMFLKYVTQTTDVGVSIFGALHGGAFLAYLAVLAVSFFVLRWPWWVAALAIAAAVPPLMTIPLEIWMRRRGYLDRRSPAPAG